MNNILESIKKTLESEANLVVENPDDLFKKEKEKIKIQIIVSDSRFELIKQSVDSIKDKSDAFYAELIQIISIYIDKLYDRKRKIEFSNVLTMDANGETILLDSTFFNSHVEFLLQEANRDLSKQLFSYLCDILQNNKELTLSIETIKRLLNRNPQLFTLSVEESYISRTFNYGKLVKILNKNQTLKKSNININDVYQILIDTFQINNDEVFGNIVKPKEFKENHQKVDEMLMQCNAKTFVAITRIIRTHFDKNFDRLQFIKKRNKNKFCERLIKEVLLSYNTEEDFDLIHKILTDEDLEIDYNYYFADYYGQCDVKSILALYGNRIIIRDLLSKKENVQKCYWYGDQKIQLYMLYAIAGDYKNALDTFLETYHYEYDYTEDFNDDFNRQGYTYGDFFYKDSLSEFINSMATSFKTDNIEYAKVKELIYRILDNEKVKYINLEKTFPTLTELLSSEDFQNLLYFLMGKYNAGTLGFIMSTPNTPFSSRYTIRVANNDEVQDYIATLNKQRKNDLGLKRSKKKH